MRILLIIISALVLMLKPRDTDNEPRASAESNKPRTWGMLATTWISAIGSLGSALTGLVSVAIAYYAYQATIEFRTRDEIKDEINITPVVSVVIHGSNKLEFENVGLGPAVVREVYLRAANEYTAIKDTRIKIDGLFGSTYSDARIGIYRKIAEFTFDKSILYEIAKRNKIDYKYKLSGNLPLSGEIIRKDDKIVLAEVNSDDVINKSDISEDDRKQWIYFTTIGTQDFNIGLCYASFTGKSFYYSGMRGGLTHIKVQDCSSAENVFKNGLKIDP